MLSPENRLMINSKVAAQRAIFSDPVPRKPGGDLLGARDIAGSLAWQAICILEHLLHTLRRVTTPHTCIADVLNTFYSTYCMPR